MPMSAACLMYQIVPLSNWKVDLYLQALSVKLGKSLMQGMQEINETTKLE